MVQTRKWTFAVTLILSVSINLGAQTGSRYELPPKEIIAAFDAPPLLQGILSPSRQSIQDKASRSSIAGLIRQSLNFHGRCCVWPERASIRLRMDLS